MKDIKFRAWHEKLNRMIYNISVHDSISEWIDETGKSWCFEDSIMQYTGLKDKNGKEIYEGDILNVKTTFENNMADKRFQNKTLCTVCFKNGCFVKAETDQCLYEVIYSITSRKIDYEVIGNIHENPELLK